MLYVSTSTPINRSSFSQEITNYSSQSAATALYRVPLGLLMANAIWAAAGMPRKSFVFALFPCGRFNNLGPPVKHVVEQTDSRFTHLQAT